MTTPTKISLLLLPLLVAGVLFALLSMTDPATVGPGGLLGVFVLIYGLFLSLLFVILHFGIGLMSQIVAKRNNQSAQQAFSIGARKAYYIASVISFAPVIFLAMQSFAQLRWTDIALVAIFMIIAIFYIIKRR